MKHIRWLTLDIISISQTTEFLLTSRVPDIESDRTSVCVKYQRMYFNTQSGCHIHSSSISYKHPNTLQALTYDKYSQTFQNPSLTNARISQDAVGMTMC